VLELAEKVLKLDECQIPGIGIAYTQMCQVKKFLGVNE